MENIQIKGARQNNLKNIDVNVPLNKFVTVSGVSGSGKSSLVYDTIFAESQRGFLSAMGSGYLDGQLLERPDVDEIKNLKPALSVSQHSYNVNPRSTLGSVTEIIYGLRMLFALIVSDEKHVKIKPNDFSPNNPSAWCPECEGTGYVGVLDDCKIIANPKVSLEKGAIPWFTASALNKGILKAWAEKYAVDTTVPFEELSDNDRKIILESEKTSIDVKYKDKKGRYRTKKIIFAGIKPELQSKMGQIDKPSVKKEIDKYLKQVVCLTCGGYKLNSNRLSYSVADKNFGEVEALTVKKLIDWLQQVPDKLSNRNLLPMVKGIITPLVQRLDDLLHLQLDYLSLSRSVPSLSGGEMQRARLSSYLSSSINGILYVFDEPSRGLHPNDTKNVIEALKRLVSAGNTVLAIEHMQQFVIESDWQIEIGPTGGPEGGHLMFEGVPSGKRYDIEFKTPEHKTGNNELVLDNITSHNLKNQSITIPLGIVTTLSGVSGSGKSTLARAVVSAINNDGTVSIGQVSGADLVKSAIYVNQNPIGKNPRSMVATYLGVYDAIRTMFSETPESKKRGYGPSVFSVNASGGRCDTCQGSGFERISMTYGPDVYVKCSTCNGRRFKDDILEIQYNGLTIFEFLEMPIKQLLTYLPSDTALTQKLEMLLDLNLGYLSLGRTSISLSGGEAQRLKIAQALTKKTGHVLYVFDEPTTGLSSVDVDQLVTVFERLTSLSNTVLIIEHNLQFIASVSDYLIDLGKRRGDDSEGIAVAGLPRNVVSDELSSWG